MSSKHLAKGDPLPPIRDGAIVFFSMGYSPYAHRVSLVLAAKGIKFDRVNCNIDNKPEFLLERNPHGSIPTIDRNGQVIWDSEVICNLLEDWYPEISLWPKDPYAKAKDRVVVTEFSKVFLTFKKIHLLKGDEDPKDVEKYVVEIKKAVTVLMEELTQRGTMFLGGNTEPGMVDYLCWPWVERVLYLEPTETLADDIPGLKTYSQEMLKLKAVNDVTVMFRDNYKAFAKTFAHGKRKFDW